MQFDLGDKVQLNLDKDSMYNGLKGVIGAIYLRACKGNTKHYAVYLPEKHKKVYVYEHEIKKIQTVKAFCFVHFMTGQLIWQNSDTMTSKEKKLEFNRRPEFDMEKEL